MWILTADDGNGYDPIAVFVQWPSYITSRFLIDPYLIASFSIARAIALWLHLLKHGHVFQVLSSYSAHMQRKNMGKSTVC